MSFEKNEAFCPYCGRKFLEYQPPKAEKILISHRCKKCREIFSVYLKPVYVPTAETSTPPEVTEAVNKID